jgi:hypothetical protein
MPLFCNNLLSYSNKNLEHLFDGKPMKHIFSVFSQCRSKTFWVDLGGKHVFASTPSVGVVHMWVMCT